MPGVLGRFCGLVQRLLAPQRCRLYNGPMPAPVPAPDSAAVRFEAVHLSFGERRVLHDFHCRFEPGRISVILGGSGAGKTTILRLVGGLVRPQAGRILVGGQDICRLRERELYDVRDTLGMMFQGGALLDSLTVYENLALPLREHRRLAEAEVSAEVRRQLASVGLADAEDLLPGQLSGGMVKRAALARALINRPRILLCDEPFSGLDPISVKRIEALLRRTNRDLGVTMLVSSHHVRSTMRMADRIVLLTEGTAITGTADELRASEDAWVREFLDDESDVDGDRDLLGGRDPESRPVL